MSPTVLVVDDNELVRRMVGIGLSRAGFRVLEAATALDALTRAREADVVLQDPDFRGLLRDLRQRTAASVVAFSGTDPGPGYDASVRKPATIRSIVETIVSCLSDDRRLALEAANVA